MQSLFQEVVTQYNTVAQYERFIKEQAQKQMDIKIYRLSKFPPAHADKVYKELKNRYLNKQNEIWPIKWHENQRRLFVWFIVSYLKLKGTDRQKLIDKQHHWQNISKIFFEKNILFLKYQYCNILKVQKRVPWKKEEDELLRQEYISQKGNEGEWNEVAKHFYINSGGKFFKTPKQCRQRWQNHLDSQVIHRDWTDEESLELFNFVKEKGQKWAQFSKYLKDKKKYTRTQHMIKNHFLSKMKKYCSDGGSQQDVLVQIINSLSDKINDQDQDMKEVNIQFYSSQIIQEAEEQKQISHEDKQPNEQNQQQNQLRRSLRHKKIEKPNKKKKPQKNINKKLLKPKQPKVQNVPIEVERQSTVKIFPQLRFDISQIDGCQIESGGYGSNLNNSKIFLSSVYLNSLNIPNFQKQIDFFSSGRSSNFQQCDSGKYNPESLKMSSINPDSLFENLLDSRNRRKNSQIGYGVSQFIRPDNI